MLTAQFTTILVLSILATSAIGDTGSYLKNNHLTQLYSSFWQSVEECFQGAYQGFNLMFKFDSDDFEQSISRKSRELRTIEMLEERGYLADVEEQKRRYMKSYKYKHTNGTIRRSLYEEDYFNIENNCTIPMNITQYRYYCGGERMNYEAFETLYEDDDNNCDLDVKAYTETVCYHDYKTCRSFIHYDECTGPPPLQCTVILKSPSEDCLTEEEQEEHGYGEVCRKIDNSNSVEVSFLLNCTQGIPTHNRQHTSKYYDAVFDYKRKDNETFWLRDTKRFLFLPFDPEVSIILRIRDFKYLADSYDFTAEVSEQDEYVGMKEVKIKIDLSKVPESAKPGGRLFYQFHLNSHAFYIIEHDRSGFLELKGYKEPQKSFINNYLDWINYTYIMIFGCVVIIVGGCLYCRHRQEQANENLLEEADKN